MTEASDKGIFKTVTSAIDGKLRSHTRWLFVASIVSVIFMFLSTTIDDDLLSKELSFITGAFSIGSFALYFSYLNLDVEKRINDKDIEVEKRVNDKQEELNALSDEIKTSLRDYISKADRVVKERNNKFDELHQKFYDLASSKGENGRQLGVVAPAGQWLHTSSWDEIVKKMREMLKMHGWGQVPAYSDIRYLISLNQIKPDGFGFKDSTLQNKTNFVKVNFFRLVDWIGITLDIKMMRKMMITKMSRCADALFCLMH
jgi:hypothetical protein